MTEVYYTGKECKNGHISYRYASNRICITCHKKYRRKKYLKNKKRETAQAIAWAKKNRKHVNELANINRKKNIKSSSAAQKKWRMKNKDKVRSYMAKKRAKRAQAVGKFTSADIKKLIKKQKAKCNGCRCCIKKKYDIDHIMPLALGGTNWPNNIQLLCSPCNSFKRAKHPKQWKMEIRNEKL